jgi:DHA1 family bicyclomycin/chloramphenicol resistance-like MFS transporter
VIQRRYTTTVGSRRWIFTLASLTAVVALSIDMSLPAQPTLVSTFHVSAETAALNLSLFMIAFAVAQIFVGYVSDAIGRRRVMLVGLGVFALAGIAAALSPSIEFLLVCRAVQGAGAATGPVVSRAMIRDTQPAARAAQILSTILTVFAIAPMLAPTIGNALLDAAGWRSIFAGLATCGVALLVYAHLTLGETLPVERRKPATLGGLFRGFGRFFATPGTRLPLLISCASFAGLFAYVAGSPFVLMQGYGVPASHYGIYFAATAFAIMLGSLAGSRMLRAGRSPGAMIVTGASFLLAGGILVAIGTRIDIGLVGFVGPMIVYFFGSGITTPSATALAMEPCPELAGTASSAIGSLTMISGSLSGYITTSFNDNSPTAFAAATTSMGAVAFVLAVAVAYARRQKQQESR